MTQKLKLRPSIFLRAARMIERHQFNYSCHALEELDASDYEMYFFEKLFKPKNKNHFYSWFNSERKRINALKKAAKLAMKENAKL